MSRRCLSPEEITTVRDMPSLSGNSLAAFVTNVLPQGDAVAKLEVLVEKDPHHNKEVMLCFFIKYVFILCV